MEQRITQLEKELAEIKQRNKRVEKEKAWETSIARKITVALITYLFVSLVFIVLQNERPFVNAIIPVVGYLLSTLSVTLIKNKWLEKSK